MPIMFLFWIPNKYYYGSRFDLGLDLSTPNSIFNNTKKEEVRKEDSSSHSQNQIRNHHVEIDV